MATPPNLRLSDSEQDCGGCKYFHQGFCVMYGDYPVDEAMVCDRFVPEEDVETDVEEA